MNRCKYNKTASERCDQWVFGDGDNCYWHDKIVSGVAEQTDVAQTLKDLPTMR